MFSTSACIVGNTHEVEVSGSCTFVELSNIVVKRHFMIRTINRTIRWSIYVVLALGIVSCAHRHEPADLVVHNAFIQTLDANQSTYEAMAIRDGKVIELGPERQILNKYQPEQLLDAGKRPIYPGFIDAHCHFLGFGKSLQQVDLVGTASFEEVVEKVKAKAPELVDDWIQGRGWDQNDWEVKEYPTNQGLNELFPDRPVLLRRVDGHAALANSVALDLAGIVPGQEIDGGEILMNNGELTGVLIDNAVDLVTSVIPDPTKDMMEEALLDAQAECFQVGLTTVDDAGLDVDEIELIDSLQQAGVLKMRVYAMVSDKPENYDHFLHSGPTKTDRLNVRSFKLYADGALGSRGACLLSPYADIIHEDYSGFLLDSISHYRKVCADLFDAGFQVNTHCIGDSANRVMLDLYGEILGGSNDYRWRIEHAQVVHKADIGKFADYTIIPSVQPTHATSDMYWAEQRLGRNRIRRAYAYQELRQQLGLVALGTDFPIEGINPLNTFYAATVRKDVEGYPEGGFNPENRLTREQALLGMTLWAAMSNFEEDEKGTIEVGKWADFVVLSQNLLTAPDDKILTSKVLHTVVHGELVYSR